MNRHAFAETYRGLYSLEVDEQIDIVNEKNALKIALMENSDEFFKSKERIFEAIVAVDEELEKLHDMAGECENGNR